MQRVSGRLPRSSQKRKWYLAPSERRERQRSPEKPPPSWSFTSGDDGSGRRRDETVWTVWRGVVQQHRPTPSAGTALDSEETQNRRSGGRQCQSRFESSPHVHFQRYVAKFQRTRHLSNGTVSHVVVKCKIICHKIKVMWRMNGYFLKKM